MFSYQCSKYSTPESVIEVFDVAKKFQEKQDTENYVSVVVLDEVGLAEDSPSLPLKALHPLLEDGTEGGDRGQEVSFFYLSYTGTLQIIYVKDHVQLLPYFAGNWQRETCCLHWYF